MILTILRLIFSMIYKFDLKHLAANIYPLKKDPSAAIVSKTCKFTTCLLRHYKHKRDLIRVFAAPTKKVQVLSCMYI